MYKSIIPTIKVASTVKVVKPDIWTRKATPEEAKATDQKVVIEEITEEEFAKRQYQDFVDWGRSRGFEPGDPRNYLPTPTESQVLQEADMRLHPEKYGVKNG